MVCVSASVCDGICVGYECVCISVCVRACVCVCVCICVRYMCTYVAHTFDVSLIYTPATHQSIADTKHVLGVACVHVYLFMVFV